MNLIYFKLIDIIRDIHGYFDNKVEINILSRKEEVRIYISCGEGESKLGNVLSLGERDFNVINGKVTQYKIKLFLRSCKELFLKEMDKIKEKDKMV